jgi:acetyl esterase/lipase
VQHRPSIHSIVWPLAVRRRDVERIRDLAYGPARPAQLLDLYRRQSDRRQGPCLVYLHGGGYRSGRKSREARALIYRLASQGWLCISANYRLPPGSPYPAALVDAKAAVAWLRGHAAEYGGDPSTIFVAGSSAGAHLAAVTALTANDPSLQPGFESADTDVAGAVCLYGFYGTPGWIDIEPGVPSSPLELADRSAPPMFVAHGDNDSFVPVSGARRFVERLRAVSQSPVVYAELPGAQHTFDLYRSVRFEAAVDGVEVFTTFAARA